MAPEMEAEGSGANAYVAVGNRREPERAIRARVRFVAHANERHLEQPHDGGQHLVARQPRPREVRAQAGAGAGQGAREGQYARVFRLVAHLAPARMVAVLLTTPGVAA